MKILLIGIIFVIAGIIHFLIVLYKACKVTFSEVETRLNYLECDHEHVEVIGIKSDKTPASENSIEINIVVAHIICKECGMEWYKDVQYLNANERAAYFLFNHKNTQLR